MTKHTKKSTSTANILRGLDSQRAGIDIGSSSVFVCVSNTQGQQEVREYSMFTRDLISMANWLKARNIKSIAMESTGSYWIPVFEILDERGFEVILTNAHHLKSVPGRKTDVKDCQWIQQLHSNGLLRGSFRPSDDFVQLRAYVRHRKQLFSRAGIQVQLMQKALLQMNVQLNLVISDITGKTGLSIIQAILGGERDPMKLASYRDLRCKKNVNEIAKALEANWREEHLFVLKQAYDAYEFHHRQIIDCEKKIQELLPDLVPTNSIVVDKAPSKVSEHYTAKKSSFNRSPYCFDAVAQVKKVCGGIDLTEIPGIDANTLLVIISEIGTDMSKWKNEKHFASWLGLCPGNKISGGKVLSSKTKPSSNRVACALRLAAYTLHRSQTALGAFFRRMRSRLGAPKAITACAHKLARILYRMLKYGVTYKELGADYYDQLYKARILANLEKKAKEFGCKLVPSEEALTTT
jgi:transposase